MKWHHHQRSFALGFSFFFFPHEPDRWGTPDLTNGPNLPEPHAQPSVRTFIRIMITQVLRRQHWVHFPTWNSMNALRRFDKQNIIQFSLVAQSCLTLCDPMNCSMPGLPVHHQLLEFTQTHVHWVGDAIQPSHPLPSPSPDLNISQHQGLFKSMSSLHQVAKVLDFQL